MELRLTDEAKTAIDMLSGRGFEAYVVGGFVRDAVMGRQSSDCDIATNALPEQIQEVFSGFRVLPTGLRHGTVTVLTERPVEITTYRVDGSYGDGRHPDAVSFTKSITEDLARRDFTVNALAYNPYSGLVDPFGGIEDIRRGLLRTVGSPEKRFSEDKLRIMRGVRFCSQLGFTAEPETACAMKRLAPGLSAVSAERKYSELKKTLMGPGVLAALTAFPQVMCAVVPELAPCVGFEQHSRYHDFDVYTHICRAVAFAPQDEALRLAALLHDIDKPARFTLDERGGHFYGHPASGSVKARQILERLRADNATADRVEFLILHHDDKLPGSRADVKRLMRMAGDFLFPLLSLMEADAAAKKTDRAVPPHIDEVRRLAQDIIRSGECFSLSGLAVNGDDMKTLGYRGREIGDCLESLLDMVIEGFPNEREQLLQQALNKRL